MSLTNHQLRSFANHIEKYGNTQSMGSVMRNIVVVQGLVNVYGLTPAGRDALATVPHLVDPEPPKPVTPETRECGACEGAGARYVARVCPLTLHERTVFVQCEAPGCERGRVTERVARPVISVKTGALPASAFAFDVDPRYRFEEHQVNEPVTEVATQINISFYTSASAGKPDD